MTEKYKIVVHPKLKILGYFREDETFVRVQMKKTRQLNSKWLEAYDYLYDILFNRED